MLTTTAADLVTRIRERSRRENSPFLSAPEYLRLVDVAWRRCYNRLAKKVPRYFATDYTFVITPGTALYTLPSDFRSLQGAFAREPSWDSDRQLRPLQESELVALQAPVDAATIRIKYTPEPTRITADGDVIPIIAMSDEWVVNCAVQMAITKEGTERQAFDMDYAQLDRDLEAFADDFDQSWPQSINETFPYGNPYPFPRTTRVEGYIMRGTLTAHQIQLWAYKFPAIYL